MKVIDLLILIMISLVTFCCVKPIKKPEGYVIKTAPVFKKGDIPAEVKVIVDEYKNLANYYGITFKNEVTVGFSDIKKTDVVGTCTYGADFREIDLDKKYWKRQTWTSKVILGYHELNHCYCTRRHDYAKGKSYPEAKYFGLFMPTSGDGFFADGCPTTIMYPYVLEDSCFNRHYKHYVKEMFERCVPY